MGIEKKHEELIEKSYIELEALQNEVTLLVEMRKNLDTLISTNDKLPVIFEEKFKNIIDLTENFSKTLGLAAMTYLDGNKILFASCLGELSIQIEEFDKEITRLVNTDFIKLFVDLQKVFIDQTRADLVIEWGRFELISNELHIRNNEIEIQIDRLTNIDLEKHFDKHQKTLSEIFGAVNAINITLTNVIQTLTVVVQALGIIQASIENNHLEQKQLFNTFSTATEKHLVKQDALANSNLELLAGKLNALAEKNQVLLKDIQTNRLIVIVGLIIIIAIQVYIAFK